MSCDSGQGFGMLKKKKKKQGQCAEYGECDGG